MDGLTQLQEHRPKLLVALVLFAAAALVPYGWLAELWPFFGRVVDALFAAEWAHIVGHLSLFVGLGTAVLILFPQIRQRPVSYFAIILALGMAQELLQLLTFKHRAFAAADLFDLLTDAAGAGLVLLFLRRSVQGSNENRM